MGKPGKLAMGSDPFRDTDTSMQMGSGIPIENYTPPKKGELRVQLPDSAWTGLDPSLLSVAEVARLQIQDCTGEIMQSLHKHDLARYRRPVKYTTTGEPLAPEPKDKPN